MVSKAVGKGQIISRSEYIKRGYIESITGLAARILCVDDLADPSLLTTPPCLA